MKRTSGADPYVIFTVTIPATLVFLRPILSELQARGWRTRVVVSRDDSDPISLPAGAELTTISMSRAITPAQDARALAQMTRLFRQERPDVVVGSTPKAAMLGMIGAKLAAVPKRVFFVRGARWDGMAGRTGTLLKRLDQLTAASATDVVAVSHSLADLFVTAGITRKAPLVIGHGGSKGVDVERFHPGERAAGSPPRMCFIGRLAEDKGIRDVLTVHHHCRQQIPAAELVVAGSVDPAQPVSQEVLDDLSAPGVSWLGRTDDVPGLLREVDLLVFPSVREGLPNVVIEAAASGVPTVGYRATGVVDAVEDGTTGRLVPVGDVSALAQAALEVLLSPHRGEMGAAARQFAVDCFAQEKVVGAFADYLETLRPAAPGTNPRSAGDLH